MTLFADGIGALRMAWVGLKHENHGRPIVGSNGVTAESKVLRLDESSVCGPLHAKHLVFADVETQALLGLLGKIAPSSAAVLIAGESGTGKELVARHIHRESGRIGKFLAVNCGAISEQLAEAELFGHEAGAFTGAQGKREGWFEAASGGTLFLDEIGDLPLSLQGKLLRVLQENEVTRLGSRKAVPIDVRIVSASNVDLAAAVAAGHFRLDLFYRLNIVPIALPPLRARPADIAALAEHFIGVYSQRLKMPRSVLRADALEAMLKYGWPGNIRELENVIHFALLVAPEHKIGVEHLRIPAGAAPTATRDLIGEALQERFAAPGGSLFRDMERRLIEEAFRHSNSNQVRTAELLGLSRNVVRTLLKRYGLISLSDSDTEWIDPGQTKAIARPATTTPNQSSKDMLAVHFRSQVDSREVASATNLGCAASWKTRPTDNRPILYQKAAL
jgi:transcriptional regulator with PAS, ATPase and Fis domain